MPIAVTYPVWNSPFGDYTLTGQALKLQVNVISPAASDYFLVQPAMHGTLWEQFWPAQGALIYHVHPSGYQSARQAKVLDPELASGLTTWVPHLDRTPVGWRDSTDNANGDTMYWAGENTYERNPVSGSDSLDYVWAHDESGFITDLFPPGRFGSEGHYFTTGAVFSDTSNPSSRTYQNLDTLQNLPTMIHVKVNLVDTTNGQCFITAWNRHWKGTIPEDVYWLDSVVVDSSLSQSIGTTLTILPGTHVMISANSHLDIAGKFWAKGTAEEPIIFEFPSNTGSGGIYMINADSVELVHCIFKRAPIVYVQGGASTLITQCVFDSCYIGLELMDAPTATTDVTENLFSHCRHGLWGSFSAGTIADNVFDACGRVGIYWQGDRANGERAFISGNEVRSCGYTLPYWGGGYFSGTTAILECNLFEHNYRYQVNCLNNANIVMNSLYSGRGNNDLIDTVAVTWCVTRRHVRHMPRSV